MIWIEPTPPYFTTDIVTKHTIAVGAGFNYTLPATKDDQDDSYSVKTVLGTAANFIQFDGSTFKIPANLTTVDNIDSYKIQIILEDVTGLSSEYFIDLYI